MSKQTPRFAPRPQRAAAPSDEPSRRKASARRQRDLVVASLIAAPNRPRTTGG